MEMTAVIDRVRPAELRSMLDGDTDIQLIDVRELKEGADMLKGAVNIPLAELEGRLSELDREKMVVAYCT